MAVYALKRSFVRMSETGLLDLLDPKFPLVFQGLLPEQKHFQMTRARLSRECAVCERPFTVFFWRIGNIPFKTYICQICAKSANVCQVSLLDLDLGIPVIVRNKLLQIEQKDSTSSAKRWYTNRRLDKKIADGEEWVDASLRDRILSIDPVLVTRVQQLVQADPYLSFKKPPVCPEWLNNECTHGASCYFAHELPGPGEHSPDNTKFGVRCRYLGTVDPNGKAIIEQLLLLDPHVFQPRRAPEPSPKTVDVVEHEEEEREIPVMTPPAPDVTSDSPVPYNITFDMSHFPRYVNGRLVESHLTD